MSSSQRRCSWVHVFKSSGLSSASCSKWRGTSCAKSFDPVDGKAFEPSYRRAHTVLFGKLRSGGTDRHNRSGRVESIQS